jgi:hypothetical protein
VRRPPRRPPASRSHHSEGIFLCEAIFGATITNGDGKLVPVRTVGEQHVKDDLGWIPSVKDWLQHIEVQPWMGVPPSGRSTMQPKKAPRRPDKVRPRRLRGHFDGIGHESLQCRRPLPCANSIKR